MKAFLLALLVSCVPTPHPAPLPPPLVIANACGPDIRIQGVCDAMFTADGLACALCENAARCIEKDAVVYCASSCLDPACYYESETGAGLDGAKKHRKHK